MNVITRAVARMDSWWNALTGIGGGVNRTAFQYVADDRLDDQTLENIYCGDAFAARICSAAPETALRQGVTLRLGDPALEGAIAARLDELHARARFTEAWTWSKVFGGGAVFVGADDGLDPAEPLDLARFSRVRFLIALDKREIWPERWYVDPLRPNFGEPEVYRLQRVSLGGGVDNRRVHASRIIRFDGAATTRRRRMENNGWGESELQRIYEKLQAFNGAFAAVGTLLQDASQGVFGIDNLYSLLAQDKKDLLRKRVEAMDMMRSVGRAILVDAKTEKFERVETTLTGLPDTLDKFIILLAGAGRIPVTVLMGQSPAGLNATGDSDIRWFYDDVHAQRMHMLRPRLERLVRLLLLERRAEPAKWSIEFPSLWQMTPKEQAELRQQVAATDAQYITSQVLTPEEVALSRFRADGWNADTSIDLEVRRAAQEADRNTPPPAPPSGGDPPPAADPPAPATGRP